MDSPPLPPAKSVLNLLLPVPDLRVRGVAVVPMPSIVAALAAAL